MRWRILRTLLRKECMRHLANRGGLALILLLVVASLLMSFFGTRGGGAGLLPSVQLCFVDYEEDSPLVEYLRGRVPQELAGRIRFRPMGRVPTDASGALVYASNTAAIQLRKEKVWFWYPGDRGAIGPYETWFWKESLRFAQGQSAAVTGPPLAEEGTALRGGLDPRSGLATSLVLFGVFFLCVYLLPSLTCEERERGVLLAQALSPVSTWELLAARFLFYPVIGLALAALLAGTYEPRALLRPFFWMSLVACVAGSLGIGMTIATLAKTQRAASMGAMCYLMAVSLLLYICQQNNIPGLPWLALEYHGPRLIHASLSGTVLWYHWGNLLGATVLAILWVVTAGVLFRRRGWQ